MRGSLRSLGRACGRLRANPLCSELLLAGLSSRSRVKIALKKCLLVGPVSPMYLLRVIVEQFNALAKGANWTQLTSAKQKEVTSAVVASIS